MADVSAATHRKDHGARIGDRAVDGLLYGMAGGVSMAVALVVGRLLAGEAPTTVLARFDPGAQSALTGTLIHLAVAGVYGLLFGVAWLPLTRRLGLSRMSWLSGVLYGLLLLAVAVLLVLPASDSALKAFPFALFAIAHVMYGLTLGLLAGNRAR